MNNVKVISIMSYCLLGLGLSLFAHKLQAEDAPELQRSSMVIVSQPEFKLNNKQVFTWANNYADISGAFKKSEFSAQQLIDDAIVNALNGKGMTMTPAAQNSLLVQYHLSLESEMDDTALAIQYGLAPGLRANSAATKKHERGTLVVDFIDRGLNKVVWRGAIAVFTGLENTAAGRQQRVNRLLVELFSGLTVTK